jgi:hypothetical protein
MNESLSTEERASHTPAPWRAVKTPLNPWWNIYIGEGDRSVADVYGAQAMVWNDPDKPEAVAANARLIAAAPDMFALLTEMEDWLRPEVEKEPDRTFFWKIVEMRRKARGQSPLSGASSHG